MEQKDGGVAGQIAFVKKERARDRKPKIGISAESHAENFRPYILAKLPPPFLRIIPLLHGRSRPTACAQHLYL